MSTARVVAVRRIPLRLPIVAIRLAFATSVAGLLASGIVGGLLRAGVALPVSGAWAGQAVVAHAFLMIVGFLGTVIALERAVASRTGLAILAPIASALAGAAAPSASTGSMVAERAPEDHAFRGRLSENLVALQMFVRHPWNGIGVGGFDEHYGTYALPLGLDDRPHRGAHNLYLEVAAETGLVGLAGFLTLVAGAFRVPVPASLKHLTQGKDGKKVAVGLRPENITSAQRDARGETANVTVEVEIVEPLGHEVIVHGRIGDDILVLSVDPHEMPRMGDKLEVKLQLDMLHLFDAETENRLG